MITICRGGITGYDEGQEVIDEVVQDAVSIRTSINTLKRDIYLLIYNDVHKSVNMTREIMFNEIKNKSKISSKEFYSYVNAGLVEVVLNICHGRMDINTLLAIKNKSYIKDWVNIYDIACTMKYATRKVPKNTKKSKMTFTVFPDKKFIMESIKLYYEGTDCKPITKKVKDDWDADISKYQGVEQRNVIDVVKKTGNVKKLKHIPMSF